VADSVVTNEAFGLAWLLLTEELQRWGVVEVVGNSFLWSSSRFSSSVRSRSIPWLWSDNAS